MKDGSIFLRIQHIIEKLSNPLLNYVWTLIAAIITVFSIHYLNGTIAIVSTIIGVIVPILHIILRIFNYLLSKFYK